MQPYPQPNGPLVAERGDSGHRGPLSRNWPQLFKKRRRYSPVRESAQQQHQHMQQQAQVAPPEPPPQQQQQQQIQMQPAQIPIHPARPIRTPSIASQSITSPTVSSIRSPSIAADTASTISSISHGSSIPSNKVPIARRGSSIAPSDRNGAGGVVTSQADLLASKSNYELISSGQHLEMGLHFSTAMATGVMMKRATHRAAEQARRDRMKNAMVDLAEFLLDGEVTFGSGTTCFVVMRGKEEDGESGSTREKDADVASLETDKSRRSSVAAGEKRTVNKARLIEMALEKMRAQEKEIELLRREIEMLKSDDVQSMDTS